LIGMADTQPVASNATKEGKAQNRRADLTIKY
jgi:flagellar motor protein MotB